MKKIVMVVTVALVSVSAAFSQERVIVPYGETPEHFLPVSYRYLNNEFREGSLSLPMGRKVKISMMNYDLYYRHLTFINEKKDTLVIKEDLAVKYADIGTERFYHDLQKGYLKILATDSVHSLTSHTSLMEGRLPTKAKDEGYGGTTNGTSATETSSRNQDMTFLRTTNYFLLDLRGEFTKCNKSSFLKMFHDKDEPIKSYIKKEKIDFDEEKDLIKLFNYCLSLK